MFHFYTPLKTSENLRFSEVFKGYINGTLDKNGLNSYKILTFGKPVHYDFVNKLEVFEMFLKSIFHSRCCTKLQIKIITWKITILPDSLTLSLSSCHNIMYAPWVFRWKKNSSVPLFSLATSSPYIFIYLA